MGNLGFIAFALDGLTLNLELSQTTGDLIEFLRHGVTLHTQFGGSLVHQVDGLIWQEPLRDITLRELDGSDTGIILDTYLMVVLVALLQTTQDRDGREFIGLIHHHRLESTLKGLILLEILLILIQGGGTDGTQFATGQGRFQDVGGIHGTLATAGTHQRVDLIDEEDDAALTLGYLVDDALQALLKLTLVLCTSHQGTHVEGVELLVLQVLRHITTHDTACQTLHDGGLTRTRFTNQNRVVLRTARENLQHTANLIVTTYHRVELTLTGEVYEVLRKLLQRLIVIVSTLGLHLLSLSQFLDSLQHILLRTAGILHDA